MKIAVASMDGANVAVSLAQARYVLVFQVLEDSVELLECRPERAKLGGGHGISLLQLPNGKSVDCTVLAAETESPAANVPAGETPDHLVREMLDCQILIVGEFQAAQERELRRLGLLALRALPGERAETAVRFVVSGTPPQEGDACGLCPNRQALPDLIPGLGFVAGIRKSPAAPDNVPVPGNPVEEEPAG